jgi:hypothetical protein
MTHATRNRKVDYVARVDATLAEIEDAGVLGKWLGVAY